MLAQLELRQAHLKAVEVRVSSAWDTTPAPEDLCRYDHQLEIEVRKRRGHWDFRVGLDVTFAPRKGETCRFDLLHVGLVGLFHLPDDVDESLVSTLVPLNCLAILYGIARGVVAQATGMVPGGPFMLPPVNFVEFMKKRRSRKRTADLAAEHHTE